MSLDKIKERQAALKVKLKAEEAKFRKAMAAERQKNGTRFLALAEEAGIADLDDATLRAAFQKIAADQPK